MNGLEPYTGRAIADLLEGDRRDAFLLNWKRTEANYGNSVDSMLLREQILLTDSTVDVLYAPPPSPSYIPGTRPVLETLATSLSAGTKSQTECALAVMRYLRDSYQRCKGRHLFYGGTEEVLLEKHEQLCEGLSRLMTALLETLRIPARMITHIVGGHVVVEIWTDGKWGYIDPRFGLYFYRPDGLLASLTELIRDPSLTEKQSATVMADSSSRFPYSDSIKNLKELYLSPWEVHTYKPYSISNAHRYSYSWSTFDDCFSRGVNAIALAHNAVRTRLTGRNWGVEPQIRISLPEGARISEDILLAVRVNHVPVQPREAHFYLDGTHLWSSDAWVPISALSNPTEGVILFGGPEGLFPASSLPPGPHTLRIEVMLAPSLTKAAEVRFIRTPKQPFPENPWNL